MTKPPVARKLAVGHLCVRQLVFWLLVVSSFNYFKMHAWSTSMLLLLHSAFMLSVLNLLLKGEISGRALKSHGNNIVDHGESWKNHGIVFLNYCGNPAVKSQMNCSHKRRHFIKVCNVCEEKKIFRDRSKSINHFSYDM